MRHINRGLMGALLLAASAIACNLPAATPTPSPTETFTSPPPSSATASPSPAPSRTPFPSLTPTPSAAPTRPPAPNARVLDGQPFLRLRSGPGTAHEVLGELEGGTPLIVAGRAGEGSNTWFQVITPDGAQGWVLSGYVLLEEDVDIAALPDTGQEVANRGMSPAGGGGAAGYRYINNITGTARSIYERGLALGNRGNVFSKVGDSLTITWDYLYQIGWGNYQLHEYEYLGPATGFFLTSPARGELNSFANYSAAAWGGWDTRDVLMPGKGTQQGMCEPEEAPLVCEYRVVRPAVAIILFGTNDTNHLSDAQYEANMRRIIDISIEMGVIPVLSTIPPKTTGVSGDARIDGFNTIVRSLSRQYSIPLMDYWAVMMTLPGYGLSDDTVHPSVPPGGDAEEANFSEANMAYGMNWRNLLTLQMLDALWRQVLYDYIPPMPTPAEAPGD